MTKLHKTLEATKLHETLEAVGDKIHSDLQRSQDIEAALPHIASKVLEHSDLLNLITLSSLGHYLAKASELPAQGNAGGLGDPPVTLYRREKFYIEVLVHTSKNMAIHDHNFCGLFGIVSGRCAHEIYDFVPEATHSNLIVGQLAPRLTEPLYPGAVRPIYSATELIHRNIHLDAPSMTIVIRSTDLAGSTRVYHDSGVSIDTRETAIERKQRRFLATLSRRQPDCAFRTLLDLLNQPIRATHAFKCIDAYAKYTGAVDRGAELVQVGQCIFGPLAECLQQRIQHETRLSEELCRILDGASVKPQ